MIVACVKVGTAYGPEYVNRLAAMVRRHTSRVMPFICITDDPHGLDASFEVIPASYPELRGWWQKVALFGGYNFAGQRIVYLDLDTVLVGNVDFLFEYAGSFAILRDFYVPTGYGSAVMSIAPGFGRHLWERFMRNPETIMAAMHGDQDWIRLGVPHADLWQDVAPGKIGSYKADNLQAGPRGFSLICFHGEPKPHEVNGWIVDAWR